MSRFSKYTDLVKYILIAIAVIVCGTIYIVSSQKEADKESSEALYEAELVMTADGNVSEGTANDTLNGAEGSMDMTTAVTEEDSNIYIYICGYVVKPGVYTVKQNTRVYELIELAGGFSEEADDTALNLVDIVSDGQKLYVPAKGESVTAVGEELQTEKALVNINTADKETLMTLPGIGEAKAEDILKYRTSNGAFQSIDEIKNISGIKEAAFSKIKDLICV